jgi:hypothetical protein
LLEIRIAELEPGNVGISTATAMLRPPSKAHS